MLDLCLKRKMIELEIPKNSLIGGWYIKEEICDNIIESFINNKSRAVEGQSYDGHKQAKITNKTIKDSLDLSFDSNILISPFVDYLEELSKVLHLYLKKYPEANKINKFGITEDINIQKYPYGGGYKKWHFEDPGDRNRCLVFMTYLNDVTDAGETEFLYQELKIQPRKGLTVIWPPYWTHTHRGIPSPNQEKYITTGWYSFL